MLRPGPSKTARFGGVSEALSHVAVGAVREKAICYNVNDGEGGEDKKALWEQDHD